MVDLVLSSAELWPYRLQVSGQSASTGARPGRLLRLDSGDHTGWGDVAPLPGVSLESIEDVDAEWGRLHSSIRDHEWRAPDFSGRDEAGARLRTISSASLRFGFEQALVGLTASTLQKSPFDVLAPGRREPVHIAGLITASGKQAVREAVELAARGYRTLKVKVGRDKVEQDAETVLEIRRAVGPDVGLRLDANRAWTLEDAIEFVVGSAAARPEFIEEPLANPREGPRLWDATGASIALDETLLQIDPHELGRWSFATHIVLKPTLLGGIAAAEAFVSAGRREGMRAVVSAAYESGLGISVLAALAARWCPNGPAAGLDTYRRLETDVLAHRLRLESVVHPDDLCFAPAGVTEDR